MKYTVIVEEGRESGYVVYAPALKGCVSQGKTKEEALKNINEAMEAYVEALLEDGLAVPTDLAEVARGAGIKNTRTAREPAEFQAAID